MTDTIKKLVKDLDENEGIILGNDVLPYMEKAIHQAIAEERERVWGEIEKMNNFRLAKVDGKDDWNDALEQSACKVDRLLSSLDKPLTDKE